jgi:glutamate carboxypeptidase
MTAAVLDWLQGRQEEMAALLNALVIAESPSLAPGSERAALALLAAELDEASFATRRLRGHGTGDHLFSRPRQRTPRDGYQLVIGLWTRSGHSEQSGGCLRDGTTASSTGRGLTT